MEAVKENLELGDFDSEILDDLSAPHPKCMKEDFETEGKRSTGKSSGMSFSSLSSNRAASGFVGLQNQYVALYFCYLFMVLSRAVGGLCVT